MSESKLRRKIDELEAKLALEAKRVVKSSKPKKPVPKR